MVKEMQKVERNVNSPMSSERDLRKKVGDTMEKFVDSSRKVVAISSCDDRRVLRISNFIRTKPLGEWKSNDKNKIETVCYTLLL